MISSSFAESIDTRPAKLWRRLPEDVRMNAALDFWADPDLVEQQTEAVASISQHRHFRPKSILALPAEKKARYLATLPSISDALVMRVVVAFHLNRRRAMMADFLDALDIAHADGLISDENLAAPDPARLERAVHDLKSKHAPDDVWLYFWTLHWQDPTTWSDLARLTDKTAEPSEAPAARG